MAYLFVDLGTDGTDGKEYISNVKPARAGYGYVTDGSGDGHYYYTQREDGSVRKFFIAGNTGESRHGRSEDCPAQFGAVCDLTYWECRDVDDAEPVTLPAGSIERLIGRKLSFWDEPVDFTAVIK
jgi:hypothetical protein